MREPEERVVSYSLTPKPRGPSKPHFMDDTEAAQRSAEQLRAIGLMAWGPPPPPPPPPPTMSLPLKPQKPWPASVRLAVLIACGFATWGVIVAIFMLVSRQTS